MTVTRGFIAEERHMSVYRTVRNAWDVLWKNLGATTPGEKLTFLLFFFTTFNAAFLQPHVTLIPGIRAKLFTGVLCLASMIAALVFVRGGLKRLVSLEGVISAILLALAAVSCAMSPTPEESLSRGFTVMASSLGGFWCARLLLNTPERRFSFAWYVFFLLAGVLVTCMITFFLRGNVWQLLDHNQHPLICRIVLMSFALLVMVFRKRRWLRISGVVLIALSFAVYSLSSIRSAMFMPLVIGGALLIVGAVRFRNVFAIIVPSLIIIGAVYYYTSLQEAKLPGDYYRLESYAFSWDTAMKKPLLGIGLMAPRDEYLEAYEMCFNDMSKEKFVNTAKYLNSSENVFLTFMVGLGIPFTALYMLSVITLYVLLVHRRRHANRRMVLPFPALLFPLTAGLLHFMVTDGLLQPQVSWFFHILLGMIPVRNEMSGVGSDSPSLASSTS